MKNYKHIFTDRMSTDGMSTNSKSTYNPFPFFNTYSKHIDNIDNPNKVPHYDNLIKTTFVTFYTNYRLLPFVICEWDENLVRYYLSKSNKHPYNINCTTYFHFYYDKNPYKDTIDDLEYYKSDINYDYTSDHDDLIEDSIDILSDDDFYSDNEDDIE